MRACTRARSAAVTLLDQTRATAGVAEAIEVTVTAKDRLSAISLRMRAGLSGRSAPMTPARPGAALANVLRRYHVAVRMSAARVKMAQSRLPKSLPRHGLSSANVSYVKHLLTGRALDVLNTLGR